MTILEFKNKAIAELEILYTTSEAQNITNLALEETLKASKTEIFLRQAEELNNHDEEELTQILSRLKTSEPIQYILGHTYFFDRKFYVNESVLIPRPETEELVQWAISEIGSKQNTKILDIGCGSGCISISLDIAIDTAEVWGIDISEDALETAEKNNIALKSSVKLSKGDLFQLDQIDENWDVIISNPPYISNEQRDLMSESALKYEPSIALFTENILKVYANILDYGLTNLQPQGFVMLELNEFHSQEALDLAIDKGYSSCEIKQDISGKDRMLKAEI